MSDPGASTTTGITTGTLEKPEPSSTRRDITQQTSHTHTHTQTTLSVSQKRHAGHCRQPLIPDARSQDQAGSFPLLSISTDYSYSTLLPEVFLDRFFADSSAASSSASCCFRLPPRPEEEAASVAVAFAGVAFFLVAVAVAVALRFRHCGSRWATEKYSRYCLRIVPRGRSVALRNIIQNN